MPLSDRLEPELKAAMKARREFAVNALREMIGALRYARINSDHDLTGPEELAVLSKLKKRHLESIEAFEKGGRAELVNQEREELKVIESFLPGPLSPEELTAMVAKAIAETGAAGPGDMGKVMAALKQQYTGRADGKAVSAEVRGQLSQLEPK